MSAFKGRSRDLLMSDKHTWMIQTSSLLLVSRKLKIKKVKLRNKQLKRTDKGWGNAEGTAVGGGGGGVFTSHRDNKFTYESLSSSTTAEQPNSRAGKQTAQTCHQCYESARYDTVAPPHQRALTAKQLHNLQLTQLASKWIRWGAFFSPGFYSFLVQYIKQWWLSG